MGQIANQMALEIFIKIKEKIKRKKQRKKVMKQKAHIQVITYMMKLFFGRDNHER